MLKVHIAGALVGLACFVVGLWISTKIHAEIGATIIAAGFFLYGKLGFKPAGPVLDRILAKLAEIEPERVARLTSKPPPAMPAPAVVTIINDDGPKS